MQLLNVVRRGTAPYFRARKSIQTIFPFLLLALLFASTPASAQLGIGSPYRTVSGGNWEDIANWEVFDGNTWIPAESYPDGTNSGPVEIRTGHNLFFVNTDITIDQLPSTPAPPFPRVKLHWMYWMARAMMLFAMA